MGGRQVQSPLCHRCSPNTIPAPLFEFTIIFKVSILMRISKTSIIEPCNNIILVYHDCIVLYRLKWNSMSSSEKAKLKATALHLVGEVCEFEKHYWFLSTTCFNMTVWYTHPIMYRTCLILLYVLQVRLNLQVNSFPNQVNLFQPRSIGFNLGQFVSTQVSLEQVQNTGHRSLFYQYRKYPQQQS